MGRGGVIQSIFPSWNSDTNRWLSREQERLEKGSYLYLEIDWSDERRGLGPIIHDMVDNPYLFELVIRVILDVDETYLETYFAIQRPDIPSTSYEMRVAFDLSR